MSKSIDAAYAFVASMVPRADVKYPENLAPMWYGWALREAFLAGVKFEQAACIEACERVAGDDNPYADLECTGAAACVAALYERGVE